MASGLIFDDDGMDVTMDVIGDAVDGLAYVQWLDSQVEAVREEYALEHAMEWVRQGRCPNCLRAIGLCHHEDGCPDWSWRWKVRREFRWGPSRWVSDRPSGPVWLVGFHRTLADALRRARERAARDHRP